MVGILPLEAISGGYSTLSPNAQRLQKHKVLGGFFAVARKESASLFLFSYKFLRNIFKFSRHKIFVKYFLNFIDSLLTKCR
jgi:hypothetical protein